MGALTVGARGATEGTPEMYDLEQAITGRHSTRLFLRDEPVLHPDPQFPTNNLTVPRNGLEKNFVFRDS
jgi:hypothetical protein